MSINSNANVIEAINTVLKKGPVRGGIAPLNAQWLVVGGGGGAKDLNAPDLTLSFKGGGGGQVVTGSALLGLSQPFTIVVGRGESFNQTTSSVSSSLFGPIYGGGNITASAAGAVGSTSGTGKTAGTTSGAGSTWWGGGGGGASANGENGVNPKAGNGGAGVSWFDGSGWGGGGGGGFVNLGSPNQYGTSSFGGGSGQLNNLASGSNARQWSGGGGGGTGNAVVPGGQTPGSDGASGSVLIAYPTPSSTATGISYGVGGVVTYATIDGTDYTIHQFTASGVFQTLIR
jgi:hypothetical protein